MSKVTVFLSAYYEDAKAIERFYKIPALVVLAQSALETGFAKSKPGNMMFGVKAGNSWTGKKQLLWTWEYSSSPNLKFPVIASGYPKKLSNGKYEYRIKDYFRAYDSPLESFVDYAKLISTASRYRDAFGTTDPIGFAAHIAKAGYATDPDYFMKVKNLINSFAKAVEKKNTVVGAHSDNGNDNKRDSIQQDQECVKTSFKN